MFSKDQVVGPTKTGSGPHHAAGSVGGALSPSLPSVVDDRGPQVLSWTKSKEVFDLLKPYNVWMNKTTLNTTMDACE